jgi:hypothetical protein
MKGDGILLRDPKINPPKVRKILETIGNEKVSSIKLVRTPLSKASEFLLNVASFGQLKEKMKEANIDKLFHLSMLINGKYILEKNEVIMLTKGNSIKSDSETQDVPVNKDITINQLLENTQKKMGDKYGPYDAKTNNCSVFLSNVLSANGLSSSSSNEFINQKTDELFKSFPKLTEKIVQAGTTAGAVVNRLIEGEGRPRRLYEADDGRYYYMKDGKRKYVKGTEGMTQQQIIRINIGDLVKPKKKRKKRRKRVPVKPKAISGMPPPPVFIKGSIDPSLQAVLSLIQRPITVLPPPTPRREALSPQPTSPQRNVLTESIQVPPTPTTTPVVNRTEPIDFDTIRRTFSQQPSPIFSDTSVPRRGLFQPDTIPEEKEENISLSSLASQRGIRSPAELRNLRSQVARDYLRRGSDDVMPSLRVRPDIITTPPSSFSRVPPDSERKTTDNEGVMYNVITGEPIRGFSGKGEEDVQQPMTCPYNYTPLSLQYSAMPIGMSNNNPNIKTELTTATPTTPAPTTTDKKIEGKGMTPLSMTMGTGCMCGDGFVGDAINFFNPMTKQATTILGLGDGGGDVDGLYNDEIETITDKLGFDVPVIASDQIDKVVDMVSPKTKEFGFIINVVPSTSDGSGKDGHRSGHWRSVYINNGDDLPSIEFYDPLGDAPEKSLLEGMKRIADKIDSDKLMLFKDNIVKHQSNDTNTCGHFAIKFLEDRFNGVPWTEATDFYKCLDQSKTGERLIKKYVKKYESYI